MLQPVPAIVPDVVLNPGPTQVAELGGVLPDPDHAGVAQVILTPVAAELVVHPTALLGPQSMTALNKNIRQQAGAELCQDHIMICSCCLP